MKFAHVWRIILWIILCLCLGGIGYMVFKINAPEKRPPKIHKSRIPTAELYVVKETAWPPTTTKVPIQLPLIALNRVTLTSTRNATQPLIKFSQGSLVAAGDVVLQLDADKEREMLREAEKRFALIQATHDRASALYAVTGSNGEVLKGLQDRLIEAEKALEQARLALFDREIVAPISGVIDYHVEQGKPVPALQPLATIHSIDRLCIEVKKDLFSIEQLQMHKEPTFPVRLAAAPNGIYHAPFTLNTNGNLILHISNHEGRYSIGAIAEIDQEALPRTRALTVPLEAIRKINEENYVWVKLRAVEKPHPEMLFIRRGIRIMAIENGYAAVVSGLQTLEEILNNPPKEGSEELLREILSMPMNAEEEAEISP